MQSFAQLITVGMKEKSISLRAVAREINLDPSFFSKVLAGKRTPPSDEKTLTKLAGLLEIDPLRLIISTGMIPSQLKPILESEDFLQSVRAQKSFDRPRKFLKPPVYPAISKRQRPELSEDLL